LPGPPDRYYADAASRVVAYLIDGVIVAVLAFGATIAVSILIGPAVSFGPSGAVVDRGRALVYAVVATALSAAYFVAFWTMIRATPGQRLLGMNIASANGDGRPTIGRAVIRWSLLGAPLGLATAVAGISESGLLIDGVVAVWYLILMVTTATSSTKQGLHDRGARTIVTKRARTVAWAGRDVGEERRVR
jgi:uncharacterized RDD family membrane protein YckC